MAGAQERMMVLKMLEEKRISAREAEELLAALDRAGGGRAGTSGPGEREGAGAQGPTQEHEPSGPEFDLGDLGRGIREAARRFAEGLGKLAEGATRGEEFGAWVRDTLGTARVTVEKEIRLHAGASIAARRVAYAGGSGDVAVRAVDATEPSGTAFLTVWGANELEARQSAEQMQVGLSSGADGLEVFVRPGSTVEWGGPPRRPARWECRLDLSVPRGWGVRLSTTSGDLSAAGIGGDSSLSTASGDVAVAAPSGSVTVRTASGDVSLRIAPSTDARIQAQTASGEIAVRAPLTVERLTATRLAASLGSGRWTVDIATASGDIVVEAEPA